MRFDLRTSRTAVRHATARRLRPGAYWWITNKHIQRNYCQTYRVASAAAVEERRISVAETARCRVASDCWLWWSRWRTHSSGPAWRSQRPTRTRSRRSPLDALWGQAAEETGRIQREPVSRRSRSLCRMRRFHACVLWSPAQLPTNSTVSYPRPCQGFCIGARPNGRKSRPKAENGGGVPGEGKQAPSPPGGLGSAVSSPSGVQGGAPTAQRFPLFSALRMASSDTIILL